MFSDPHSLKLLKTPESKHANEGVLIEFDEMNTAI